MTTCARPECRKQAHPQDPYCSTTCAKLHHGVINHDDRETPRERKNRRARIRYLEKKIGGKTLTIQNPEAMNRRLPGSYGTGKRQ